MLDSIKPCFLKNDLDASIPRSVKSVIRRNPLSVA